MEKINSNKKDIRAMELKPNDVMKLTTLVNDSDFSDWNDKHRMESENMGVEINEEYNQIGITDPQGRDKTFTFNKVLGMHSTQQDAFKAIGDTMVEDIFGGINATVIMYGQTGSGKTYTTFGPEPFAKAKLEDLGVLPISFALVF
eukprot:UN33873